LMRMCATEIARYQCNSRGAKFEDIIECLREKFNDLSQCNLLRAGMKTRLQIPIVRR
jgi:hypothetical protein